LPDIDEGGARAGGLSAARLATRGETT
jgi:hypothetical protein